MKIQDLAQNQTDVNKLNTGALPLVNLAFRRTLALDNLGVDNSIIMWVFQRVGTTLEPAGMAQIALPAEFNVGSIIWDETQKQALIMNAQFSQAILIRREGTILDRVTKRYPMGINRVEAYKALFEAMTFKKAFHKFSMKAVLKELNQSPDTKLLQAYLDCWELAPNKVIVSKFTYHKLIKQALKLIEING